MTRLEELLLFLLDRAKKAGIKNLSAFQMFKIPYLIQVLSLKYAGTPFIPETTFVRDKNGPISVDIYDAIEKLEKIGYIRKDVSKNPKHAYPRHNHSLSKKPPKLSFDQGEIIFLDNFLNKLLPLSHTELRVLAYSTEPMKAIQKTEKWWGGINKGAVLDFSAVVVDPDTVDTYSDSDEALCEVASAPLTTANPS